MPPGARVGDMTAHGTPLTGTGSATVLVGGMPAWRAAVDVHTCAVVTSAVPHGSGVVTMGAPTVLIEGAPAARQGDTIVENGPPNIIASGEPTVLIGGGSTATEPPWVATLFDQLSSYVDAINEDLRGRSLGVAGRQLRGERVDLHVDTESGQAAFSFRTTADGTISEFARGTRDDATARMDTDGATVDRLAAADDPIAAFQRAYADGHVTITGIGPINTVEWWLVDTAVDVARLLGLG